MPKFEIPISVEVLYTDAPGGIKINTTTEIEAMTLEEAQHAVAFMLGSLGVLVSKEMNASFYVSTEDEDLDSVIKN